MRLSRRNYWAESSLDPMLSTIPVRQFIGSSIEHVIFLLAGAYIYFFGHAKLSVRLVVEAIFRELELAVSER